MIALGPIEDCEVCLGRDGVGEYTIEFTARITGESTIVHMCQECLRAIFKAMLTRYNESVAAGNAEVEAVIKWFGFEPPSTEEPT